MRSFGILFHFPAPALLCYDPDIIRVFLIIPIILTTFHPLCRKYAFLFSTYCARLCFLLSEILNFQGSTHLMSIATKVKTAPSRATFVDFLFLNFYWCLMKTFQICKQIICNRFSWSLWNRTDLSLVLNFFLISFVKPIFAANSFIKRSPASEDKSPPLKFILICLLLWSEKVFTILIKGSFVWDC